MWESIRAEYYLATCRVFIVDDYFFPIYVIIPSPRRRSSRRGTPAARSRRSATASSTRLRGQRAARSPSPDSLQLRPHPRRLEELAGASGWNLIGGYEIVATAALVTTNPPGQQSGPIFKYSGGYSVATQLVPGYGYWIKLSSAAQIIIPETLAKDGKPVEWFPENWGKIVLTDATGINYTLYAVKGETDLSQYELPPAPMAGMFDIRYSSGRIAEDLNSAIKTIEMSGVTYPLTVRVEGMDIRLMDETGKNVNVNLKSGEDVVISDATIQKLMVTRELIPADYALEQNYPNPSNPRTESNSHYQRM